MGAVKNESMGSIPPIDPSKTLSSCEPAQEPPTANQKPWKFYVILISLSFITFISSPDGSVIAVALQSISAELSAGDQYVWITNSFLVAQVVVQPPCAQLCNIFGRHIPAIVTLAIFALGSGIAGGAFNSSMLIAGRTIQGVGSGGFIMLVELIICDMVPVRERGKYLGMVLSASAIGAITGPVFGGALTTDNWRWIFYMNLPISVSWHEALGRVDWTGNILFISFLCSLLYGLVVGGTVLPWSSWRVIVPISMPPSFCLEPSVPSRIFGNRTSAAGFYIDFISSALLQWVCFFWPIYFQGIGGTTPLRAGINFIPFEAFLIVAAAVAGGVLSKFGYYRPIHLIGFCLTWVVFQMVDGIGRGLLLPTVLPAIMASLPDSDTASATGMYSFLRSFGFVWGVTIPAMIFNAQFDRYSPRISDPTVRQEWGVGRAYQSISGSYLEGLTPKFQGEVMSIYREALIAVWIGAVAFGATGFISVAIEKHIPLRTELNTKFGLEEDKARNNEEKTL
ncbi:major facilitator superfamily domain-containing protein [Phaeosphaeriaceae sp. PMI808]|nr:major facilitator superfamily domain-containing protein [Phaeosphaeriaceae sp. PMI808]